LLVMRNGCAGEASAASGAPVEVPSAEGGGCIDATANFSANLVLQEEGGFELWLGSMEDSLNLDDLTRLGLNALLNCALRDCEAECAGFRERRRGLGRARSHTRGNSMSLQDTPGRSGLDRDQVMSLACFDAEWYSEVLQRDVAYCSISAADEAGYDLASHFAEVITFLGHCRSDGRKVLAHCVMGINRAPACVVAFLCGGLGMSLEAAVDLVSRRRGHILNNASFLDQLIESYGAVSSEEGVPAAAAG